MDGPYHKPLLLALCLVLAGCSSPTGERRTFMQRLFGKASDEVPGIMAPQKRVTAIRAMASEAASRGPEAQEQLAQRFAALYPKESDPLIRTELVRASSKFSAPTASALCAPPQRTRIPTSGSRPASVWVGKRGPRRRRLWPRCWAATSTSTSGSRQRVRWAIAPIQRPSPRWAGARGSRRCHAVSRRYLASRGCPTRHGQRRGAMAPLCEGRDPAAPQIGLDHRADPRHVPLVRPAQRISAGRPGKRRIPAVSAGIRDESRTWSASASIVSRARNAGPCRSRVVRAPGRARVLLRRNRAQIHRGLAHFSAHFVLSLAGALRAKNVPVFGRPAGDGTAWPPQICGSSRGFPIVRRCRPRVRPRIC